MLNIEQKYLEKAYRILMNSPAQRERFEEVNYGVNTPIDAKKLPDVPLGKVILSLDVFEQLLIVNDESERAQAEFTFILTGITERQTVKFDNIVWARNQGNRLEGDFTPLEGNLNSYVKTVLQLGAQNQIILMGHTHPQQLSRFAQDFSLGDMAGFIQFKEDYDFFKNGEIELCGGIMSNLYFNFCFYDYNMQDFYKFDDVVIGLENGEQIQLSCYGRKVNRKDISNKLLAGKENKPGNSFEKSLRQGVPTQEEQRAQAKRRFHLLGRRDNNRDNNRDNGICHR